MEPNNTGLNWSLAVNIQRKQGAGSTSTMKGQGKIPMNCGTKSFHVICYCSLTFYSLKTPIIFMSTCKSLNCCQSRDIYQTISVDLGRPGFHSHAHLSFMSITVPQQFRMLSKEKVHVSASKTLASAWIAEEIVLSKENLHVCAKPKTCFSLAAEETPSSEL